MNADQVLVDVHDRIASQLYGGEGRVTTEEVLIMLGSTLVAAAGLQAERDHLRQVTDGTLETLRILTDSWREIGQHSAADATASLFRDITASLAATDRRDEDALFDRLLGDEGRLRDSLTRLHAENTRLRGTLRHFSMAANAWVRLLTVELDDAQRSRLREWIETERGHLNDTRENPDG